MASDHTAVQRNVWPAGRRGGSRHYAIIYATGSLDSQCSAAKYKFDHEERSINKLASSETFDLRAIVCSIRSTRQYCAVGTGRRHQEQQATILQFRPPPLAQEEWSTTNCYANSVAAILPRSTLPCIHLLGSRYARELLMQCKNNIIASYIV